MKRAKGAKSKRLVALKDAARICGWSITPMDPSNLQDSSQVISWSDNFFGSDFHTSIWTNEYSRKFRFMVIVVFEI